MKFNLHLVRRAAIPLAALALLVGLGLAVTSRPADPNAQGSPLQGRPAPDFALERLDGGRLGLGDLRGKRVVLNFWASWCVPCRDEAPLLRDAQIRYARQGVVFVGIVFNDTPQKARDFVAEFGLTYPNLIDGRNRSAVEYGVTGLPETYFIDASGVVVSKKIGPVDGADLERRVEELLARKRGGG